MEAVSEGAIWHPGQSATLRLGPKAVLAEFGALHPALTRHFDIDGPAMAVHIFLDAIPAKRASGPARAAFAPPAPQSVRRHFAFLAPPPSEERRVGKAGVRTCSSAGAPSHY